MDHDTEWRIREPGALAAPATCRRVLELVLDDDETTDRFDITGVLEAVARAASELGGQ